MGGKRFQPFSPSDEAELVRVLTTKPRHVARRVRQLVTGSRKQVAYFRNAATYLMIVLQNKLQAKEISPEDAGMVVEGLLKECATLKLGDMAHLLFRAAVRFRKYGLKISVSSVRLLFSSYRENDARDLLKGLAEEMRNIPELRALTIAAYLAAGLEQEAMEIMKTVSLKDYSSQDCIGIIESYGKRNMWEQLLAFVNQLLELSDCAANLGEVLSAAIPAAFLDPPTLSAIYKSACERHLPLTDFAVGYVARSRMTDNLYFPDVVAMEAEMKKELGRESLGPFAESAVVAKLTEQIVRGHAVGDQAMLVRIQHLQDLIEAQVAADTVENIEPQYIIALIKGYGALGKTDEMRKAFNYLLEHKVLLDYNVWDEMLRWYSKAGNVKELIAVKDAMTAEGIQHTWKTYDNLFRGLDAFYPNLVKRYYDELMNGAVRPTPKLYVTLLGLFARLGEDEIVEKLYNAMKQRAHNGDQMFPANLLAPLLSCFHSNQDRCDELVRYASDNGFLAHPSAQASVIAMFSRRGRVDELQKFVASIPGKSPAIFRELLHFYGRQGNRVKFEEVMKEMRSSGVMMSAQIISVAMTSRSTWGDDNGVRALFSEARDGSLVKDASFYGIAAAAFARMGNVDAIDEAWKDLLDSKLTITMAVYNRFLDLFMARNKMDMVQHILDHMMANVPPNPITATTVLDMLGKMGRLSEMEALLLEMRKSKEAAPTVVTYHQAMNAFARVGDVTKMQTVHQMMVDAGMKENAVTYNILFQGFGRAKRFEHLAELVAERKVKGVPMEEMGYMVLLALYSRAGMPAEVNDLVNETMASGTELTSRLLVAIATAYSFAGDAPKVDHYVQLLMNHKKRRPRDVESAFLIYSRLRDTTKLQQMLQSHKSEFIYNVCVSAFAKAGEHGKVAQLLQEMNEKKLLLSTNTSITLSSLLLKAGKVDLAQAVLKWKKKDYSHDEDDHVHIEVAKPVDESSTVVPPLETPLVSH